VIRVVLVGPASARARLREQANGSLAVIGEFGTLAAAREAALDADALLVASNAGGETAAPTVEALTSREVEVLELLAEGLSNKGIAARLGISDQTAKFHVAAILGKLGAHNRTEAVRLGVRRGLVTF
jgi:two-component system nitrate/nitrite response regulator NarL